MNVSIIGMDIAKSVFHVHAIDASGAVVERRKLPRRKVVEFFAGLSPCIVALEACGSAHYWGRALQDLGHEVRLVPPAYVKAYVKRGKNDAVDAAAICEAASRPSMHFVPVKSASQQAMLTQHRVREKLIRDRTGQINALRSLAAEFGLIAPTGRPGLGSLIERLHTAGEAELPETARTILLELVSTIEALDAQLARIDKAIRQAARESPTARLLMTVPGIGPIAATAILASVGDPGAFRNGRHFAAWLGLVVRQHSTAGRIRLGRISKMGDRYLRKLLVLGATSLLRTARTGHTPLQAWTRRLLDLKKPARVVSVALANKLARILWAVMASGQPYRPERAAA